MYGQMVPATVIGAVSAVIALIAALFSFIFLASYILGGIAYFKLAKSRGIKYPGLAWVPLVNIYLIGKIADDIKSKYKEETNRGTTLLVLTIVTVGISIVMQILSVFMAAVGGITSVVVVLAIIILVACLAILVISIYTLVLYFTTINIIYKEYNPDSATTFTVLSVILTCIGIEIIVPIFMLTLLNKTPAAESLTSEDD